jgi:WD40 repeat protein
VAACAKFFASGGDDETVNVFDAKKLVERGSLFGHKGTVNALSFSGSSDLLLSGGADCSVLLWKTKEWERVAALQGHTGEVSTVACHPSGAVCVSGSRDCTLRLWDLSTLKCINKTSFDRSAHGAGGLGLAGRYDGLERVRWGGSDGSSYAVARASVCQLFEATSDKPVATFSHSQTVTDCDFTSSGLVVTGCNDCCVRVWDRRQVSARFSQEYKPISSSHSPPQASAALIELPPFSARVKCVAVRGSCVVAAGSDGEVRVTDLSAAATAGGPLQDRQPRLSALAVTGARITSCALGAARG